MKMCDDEEPPAKRSKDDLGQFSNELQKFETISTTKLLDLNDYCFDEIFGYLDVIELCSVSQVCKQFQKLAELYFKRKYSEFDFSTLFAGRVLSNQEARDILCNFGPMIKSMTIPRNAFHNLDRVGHVEEGLLKDTVECCGETLHTLTLTNFHFTSHAVESLNMLFKTIQALSLVGSIVAEDCIFHLSNFSALKRLTISDTLDCYALMGPFPALEYLKLWKVSISCECMLRHFIVTHKHLRTLSIKRGTRISSDTVRCIGKYMKNLNTLCIDGNRGDHFELNEQIKNNNQHLSELKNLEFFQWNNGHASIDNLLAKMVSNRIALKVLVLVHCVVDDETIKAIEKMKTLKYLKFQRTKGLKDQELIKIGKEVTQLKTFTIEAQQDITSDVLKEVLCHTTQLKRLRIYLKKIRFDPAMYSDISDIVEKRRNGIKLTIQIYSTDVQHMMPPQQTNMNKNWLIIEYFNTERDLYVV